MTILWEQQIEEQQVVEAIIWGGADVALYTIEKEVISDTKEQVKLHAFYKTPQNEIHPANADEIIKTLKKGATPNEEVNWVKDIVKMTCERNTVTIEGVTDYFEHIATQDFFNYTLPQGDDLENKVDTPTLSALQETIEQYLDYYKIEDKTNRESIKLLFETLYFETIKIL